MNQTIIVTPFLDGGYSVTINGEPSATFDNGGVAAAAWAQAMLRVRHLESVIDAEAAWLHSMTPAEVADLDSGRVRARADGLRRELRSDGQ